MLGCLTCGRKFWVLPQLLICPLRKRSLSGNFIPQVYIQLIPYIRWSTSRMLSLFLFQSVWKLIIPPRVQFFLWLLSKDKILTRNNLSKRQNVADSCLFCGEEESVAHLFFKCVVAMKAWGVMSEVLGVNIGANYESVASL
jgi:hypothetical protein